MVLAAWSPRWAALWSRHVRSRYPSWYDLRCFQEVRLQHPSMHLTFSQGTFILNRDVHWRLPSVPKTKVVHVKSDFILVILAKSVHTEHVTSCQFTNGNLTFVHDILFPSVGVLICSSMDNPQCPQWYLKRRTFLLGADRKHWWALVDVHVKYERSLTIFGMMTNWHLYTAF